MGIARELIALEELLRKDPQADPFTARGQERLRTRPETQRLEERLASWGAQSPADVLLLAIQALRVQHTDAQPELVEAELVATLPDAAVRQARATQQVVWEMVRAAEQEIILLGYELTSCELIEQLSEAAQRGADVILICNDGASVTRRIDEAWAPRAQRPRIFELGERSQRDGVPFASMHAKSLLVDELDLLVTSANFTFHGLRGNISLGCA